jgi:site-specific DNA-cytosine methylase
MIALKRNQIPVAKYYACEIDKYAIQISKKNHPEIQHLGDVTKLINIPTIDLLIGGSPCQDLSIAKKNRKGLDGERSGLFWEYVRILKESKPKYFVLENVNSMPKEAKEIITNELGVQPIMINASLVSAQCRKRLFWTNIPVKELPIDKGILLKDILENGEVDERMTSKGKSFCLDANYFKGSSAEHSIEKKVRTMVGNPIRKLTPIECERLQGLPDDYTKGISNTQRYKCIGNAFNVDVICFILNNFTEEL